jgi:hypothetical protein
MCVFSPFPSKRKSPDITSYNVTNTHKLHHERNYINIFRLETDAREIYSMDLIQKLQSGAASSVQDAVTTLKTLFGQGRKLMIVTYNLPVVLHKNSSGASQNSPVVLHIMAELV